MPGNRKPPGGLEGPQPLQVQSAAATCAVRGAFLRSRACPARAKMLSLRLFRPGVPQGREEKAFISIKWILHLIEGAVQQPLFIHGLSPGRGYIFGRDHQTLHQPTVSPFMRVTGTTTGALMGCSGCSTCQIRRAAASLPMALPSWRMVVSLGRTDSMSRVPS